MGGSAKSSSASTTSSETITATDSYNQTYNRINNLSDVGNVKLNLGDASAPGSSGLAGASMPLVAVGVGILIFAAITIFRQH